MNNRTMVLPSMPPPPSRRPTQGQSFESNRRREHHHNGDGYPNNNPHNRCQKKMRCDMPLPTSRGSFQKKSLGEWGRKNNGNSGYGYASNPSDDVLDADVGRNGPRGTTTRSSTSITEVLPTSLIPYNESNHAAMRRDQRDIGIREMQAVLKYGVRTPGARPNTFMYKYEGKTYIQDDSKRLGITCYQLPKEYKRKIISAREQHYHYTVLDQIRSSKNSWTSHTVLIVDKSGSMRLSDVKRSKSRFQGTWGAIADDFVAQRIETGEAKAHDVVSVILMGDEPLILFDNVPTDWILYNRILDLYHGQYRMQLKRNGPMQIVEPGGHGNYIPALELARKMLSSNNSSSCALSLAILTDGRPSDFNGNIGEAAKSIVDTVSGLASQFGRRFTVATIGMGNSGRKDQFDILRNMVSISGEYGSTGLFQLPSMNSSSLGAAFSSLASSVTNTQREMTSIALDGTKGKQRQVRQVLRERPSSVPFYTEVVDNQEFDIYMNDKVHRMEYDCESKSFKKAGLQHPDAKGVAKRTMSFGEGAERLAFQFFEIASDGCTVVGEPLVAKSSRFIEKGLEDEQKISTDGFGRTMKWSKWRARDDFVKKFCERQHKARKLAEMFNKKLDSIPRLDPDTPRVTFLDCSVYYTDDVNCGEAALLVERKLNGKFTKWNGNNGYVRKSDSPKKKKRERPEIMIIPEDCDVLQIDSAEQNDESDFIFISKNEVAQAFSHFTFHHSGEKMVFVDLQGEYDSKKNKFYFTDPVIHYYNKQNPGKRNLYGRTDMGRKGVERFFDTHVCNALCPLITRGFKDVCPLKQTADVHMNHLKKRRCAL